MKLPQLLSQFLYQNKTLNLTGLGTFTMDPAAVIPEESDRNAQSPATGIQFKNTVIHTPDDTLITFIKDHTGKMKSLAASDLDFFLTTGKQLLNIGKPFYIEGIGTLIKNKEGKFDFTPGEYMITRLDTPGAPTKPHVAEEPTREHEPRSTNVGSRQALLLIGLIGGLIVIGWGGYYLYKKNNYIEPTAQNQATVLPDTLAASKPDASTSAQPAADTTQKPAATTQTPATTTPPTSQPAATTTPAPAPVPSAPIPVPEGSILYRFVILQTPNKNHALRRYNQLLGYQLNIKMDQKDSAWFKLYFPIAATIRDTTHIKDSLEDVYAAHVTIER